MPSALPPPYPEHWPQCTKHRYKEDRTKQATTTTNQQTVINESVKHLNKSLKIEARGAPGGLGDLLVSRGAQDENEDENLGSLTQFLGSKSQHSE